LTRGPAPVRRPPPPHATQPAGAPPPPAGAPFPTPPRDRAGPGRRCQPERGRPPSPLTPSRRVKAPRPA
jgi:hypothetical protein